MSCRDHRFKDANASRPSKKDALKRKPNMFQCLLLRLGRSSGAGQPGHLLESTSTTNPSAEASQHTHDRNLTSADEQLEAGGRRDDLSHIEPMEINEETVRVDGKAVANAQPTSKSLTKPEITTANTTLRCDSCQDDFPVAHLGQSACSHRYCETCHETFIRTAMAGASVFPPRCCRQELSLPIPLKLVREYSAKLEEFGTPHNKRVYCQQRTCSEFIPPYWIVGGIALCLHCGQKTCIHCKSASHGGADCPMDTAMLSLLELAHKKGYQRCYNCRQLVERRSGCDIMTCRCGSQFCYQCGRAWQWFQGARYPCLCSMSGGYRGTGEPARMFDGGYKAYTRRFKGW